MTPLPPSAPKLALMAHRLAWMFVLLKVASTIVQLRLFGGDYRRKPQGTLFRTVYLIGKATPSLVSAAFCVESAARYDWLRTWAFGLLAILIAIVAAYVVRLRQQGRFFGLLDLISKR